MLFSTAFTEFAGSRHLKTAAIIVECLKNIALPLVLRVPEIIVLPDFLKFTLDN